MIEKVIKFIVVNRNSMGEKLLGLFNILWGIWLLNPAWDTFSLTSYYVLSLIGPESYWGLSILLFGLVLTYFSLGSNFVLRRIFVFLNMTIWGFVSISIGISNIETASVVAYAIISLFSFWHYLRISILDVFRSRYA